MSGILGRKVGMTVKFGTGGEMIPVTVIQAGPCKIIKRRTVEKDGYEAGVLGFEEVEGAKLKKKALLGFFKKLGTPCYRVVREFRKVKGDVGTDVTVNDFKAGDLLKVTGTSIGKGWTGGIKKWNFSGGRGSHGGNFKRAIGSCGMKEWPGRTLKGKKMSGHMGVERVTTKSIEVIDVLPEDNVIVLKGPITGFDGGLVILEKYGVKKAAESAA